MARPKMDDINLAGWLDKFKKEINAIKKEIEEEQNAKNSTMFHESMMKVADAMEDCWIIMQKKNFPEKFIENFILELFIKQMDIYRGDK